MRDTSIEAFRKITENGWLGRTQEAVYTCLYHHGPLTRSELDASLKHSEEVNPSYHKRLSELKRMGLAIEVGKKTDPRTKKGVLLWDVTSAEFVKPLPTVSGKQQLRMLLRVYVVEYPQSCGCIAHGRDRCLLHISMALLQK